MPYSAKQDFLFFLLCQVCPCGEPGGGGLFATGKGWQMGIVLASGGVKLIHQIIVMSQICEAFLLFNVFGTQNILVWYLLYYMPIQFFSICMFIAFNAIRSPCAPLFEKECCFLFLCLLINIANPFRLHRTC